jgi:hypothetical protein
MTNTPPSAATTTPTTPSQEPILKLPFTPPSIRPLGNVLTMAGQGGSSKEYDSYNENRK